MSHCFAILYSLMFTKTQVNCLPSQSFLKTFTIINLYGKILCFHSCIYLRRTLLSGNTFFIFCGPNIEKVNTLHLLAFMCGSVSLSILSFYIWNIGILLYEMLYGRTPFRGRNRQKTFANILHKDLTFPSSIPVKSHNLFRIF